MSDNSLEGLFRILGCCPEESTEREIRSRFLQLVRELHPDRAGYSTDATLERFSDVVSAFRQLMEQFRGDGSVNLADISQSEKDDLDARIARDEMLRNAVEALQEERQGLDTNPVGHQTVNQLGTDATIGSSRTPMVDDIQSHGTGAASTQNQQSSIPHNVYHDNNSTQAQVHPNRVMPAQQMRQPPQQPVQTQPGPSISISVGCGGRSFASNDLIMSIDVTLEEVLNGGTRTLLYARNRVCSQCSGDGYVPAVLCPTCLDHQNQGGSGFRTVRLRPEPASCKGCDGDGGVLEVLIPCEQCGGSGSWKEERAQEITIPVGLPDGLKYCVAGGGNERVPGQIGRLVVVYHVKEHGRFLRRNSDILLKAFLPIKFGVAAIGGDVPVVGLDGQTYHFHVLPGTQCGDRLTVCGAGLPEFVPPVSGCSNRQNQNQMQDTVEFKESECDDSSVSATATPATVPKRGSLHVKVAVETPTALNDHMKELIMSFESQLTAEQYPAVSSGEFKCWDRIVSSYACLQSSSSTPVDQDQSKKRKEK